MINPSRKKGRTKKWRTVLIIASTLIVALLSYGWYLYTKQPPDTRKMAAAYTIEATQLVKDFRADEKNAGQRYVDKVLIVSGKVMAIEKTPEQAIITLDGEDPLSFITCSFYDDEITSLSGLSTGTAVRIKGNCTGYLTDVILNKCSIIE